MNYLCKKSKFLFVTTVVAGLLFISSCKDSSNPISNLDQIVFPDTGISYQKQVQVLFNVGCAYSGCHDASDKTLNLTVYGGWYSDPLVIIPKDTSKSRFVWNIEAKPGSAPMPPAKPLSDNQINGLKRWILEGARDTP
ncbi:MAG TPA: hypothetical protein VMM58_14065 [Bacteroidota bacterium]|nr:hypothetical protein [Bacteroidota bacterium]